MRQNEEIIKSRPASSLISIFILRQRMGVDRRSLQPARELWGSLRVKPSTRSLLDMNLCGWLSHVVTIQNIMFKGRTTTCDIIWRYVEFQCQHFGVLSRRSCEVRVVAWVAMRVVDTKTYDDFSTPCFDGRHHMIMGGSFASVWLSDQRPDDPERGVSEGPE
jgi:hypothetical protein